MKISPVSASGATVGAVSGEGAAPQSMVQKIRAMRMTTNVTPGQAPPTDQKLSPEHTGDEGLEASEETKPLSPQFAALARQRRALQVKEREIADREKALTERTSTQGDAVDKARLKSDPLGVLLDAGVTYEQLAEAVMASQEKAPYNALEAKIRDLEQGFEKKLTERDAQQEQQVLAEMRREALGLVAQGDAFELVRETKSIPDVMQLIERTYRETGNVLEVREALQLVEDELVKDSLKLAGLSKVRGQLAPVPAPMPNQQRTMRTLTNRDTASVPLDRKARALAAFTGTLKR